MMQLTQGSDINWDSYDRINFLCPLNHCFMEYKIQSFGRLDSNWIWCYVLKDKEKYFV